MADRSTQVGLTDENDQQVSLANFGGSWPDTIEQGSKTVTTAGTQVQITATAKKGMMFVKAKSSNTNNIYIGNSSVDNQSTPVERGEWAPTIVIDNSSKIWLDSDTNGEGINYILVYIN